MKSCPRVLVMVAMAVVYAPGLSAMRSPAVLGMMVIWMSAMTTRMSVAAMRTWLVVGKGGGAGGDHSGWAGLE